VPLSRRSFLSTGAAAAAGLALPRLADGAPSGAPSAPSAAPPAPAALARPAVVASANGLRGVARALEQIGRGTDPLDAAIAGVNIQELDPEDQSVGLGGLPNEEGVVQLDASCMHGPTRRAGAVAALEDIATPSLVAKAVMDYTDHILLVGEGAKQFALRMGFTTQNLLTEKSRQDWLRWRARLHKDDAWLDHDDDVAIKFTTGTINMNAVTAAGDLASVTTTSGLAWKLRGRAGDSPIIGAGQYTDNDVGSAGSTGRGEANIKVCGAFLTVEHMRRGMTPEQACLATLERVVKMTEPRLLGPNGRPRFQLNFYALAKDGRVGGAALYEGSRYAVADEKGARLVESAYLYKRAEYPR
jgi:N4-(beta-N-acetylglucosaminyl)-L-asparaginase